MSGGLTRVGILCTIGVCGTLLFGGLCLTSYCITTLWIFLELCSLSLIPCFYSSENRLSALFQYIVVTRVSSSCFLLAVLCGGYRDKFFVLGFLIKMAVFPFMGWFYKVGTSGG